MKFSLKQIAIFDAIADTGSVSAAATRIAISQSAASMALQQLEQQVGTLLFDRQGKRLVLNSWGLWLRPRAKALLQDVHQIEMGLNAKHSLSGQLKLSASQTVAESLIPSLISNLDSNFPQIQVKLEVKNSQQIIQDVRSFNIDLGVIEGRCDDSRINQSLWCEDELVIVAAATHPYARQDEVSYSQLEASKWVLRESGSGTRDVFDAAIFGKLEHLDVIKEYDHIPTLIALIAAGEYISCLPLRSCVHSIQHGLLKPLNIKGLSLKRHFSFIWHKEMNDDALRDCLIKEAKRLIR